MNRRALRSLLFVPGNRPRMLERARTLPADAVILDLEDGVPANEKERARAMVRAAFQAGDYDSPVIVRINAFDTGLSQADLEAIPEAGVQAICLPKAETPDDVQRLASAVADLEQERGLAADSVELLLMVETALGVLNAYEMAKANARVRALCIGGEDLCRDLGATRTKQGLELMHARAHVVLAARASSVLAIDTVYTDLSDQAGLLAEASFARALGYSGKMLVHPEQIATIHRAFAPGQEEVAYASRVVEEFEAGLARGEGTVALDGIMIDAPIVARAREVLARAEEC